VPRKYIVTFDFHIFAHICVTFCELPLWKRNTPHSTTAVSPAQLLLGRPLRTVLDLVKPNLNRKMVNQQHQQSIRAANEKGRQCRQLEVDDSVMSRDYRGDLKWRSGLIVKKTGPLLYEVQGNLHTEHRASRRNFDWLFC